MDSMGHLPDESCRIGKAPWRRLACTRPTIQVERGVSVSRKVELRNNVIRLLITLVVIVLIQRTVGVLVQSRSGPSTPGQDAADGAVEPSGTPV
jgi:hypothetical protein